jgi:hypothetical protein
MGFKLMATGVLLLVMLIIIYSATKEDDLPEWVYVVHGGLGVISLLLIFVGGFVAIWA